MRFGARDLKPYADPVQPDSLKEGEVYFSVTFIDDGMLEPVIETLVFIGADEEETSSDGKLFQDANSYYAGIRLSSATEADGAKFSRYSKDSLNSLFEFEQALEALMACSMRREALRKPAS